MGKHSKNEKKRKKDYVVIETNKRGKKGSIVKKILLTLLIIVIIAVGFFAFQVYRNGGGMKGIVTTFVGTDADTIKNLEDMYVLCMGKSENLTDTIMVAKYSPKNQQASLLSIPRDCFVGKSKASANSYDKINARYQDNPQNTIDAVNDFTGLNIKYYVTVDTKALRELVDAIGGVEFDVPIDMDYDDPTQNLEIHLKKGVQVLNGMQAEGVVRFRHNNDFTTYSTEYGDNDLGRMKTQRAFITTVLKQTLKATNITKINDLINIAKERVETNLSWDIIKSYIVALMDFNTENLRSDVLPGTPQYINGLSFFVVDRTGAKKIVNELFLSQPDTSSGNSSESNETNTSESNTTSTNSSAVKPSSLKLEVINGTGSKEKFTTAQEQLKEKGYKISQKGSTNVTAKTVIINRKECNNETLNELKSLLCTGTSTIGKDDNDVDITIILGTDY